MYSKYDYNAWKLNHGIDKTSFTFEKDHSVQEQQITKKKRWIHTELLASTAVPGKTSW